MWEVDLKTRGKGEGGSGPDVMVGRKKGTRERNLVQGL